MKFQGFVGPAYTLNSVNVDCQRCVNLYPELIESGTGKEGQVSYLKATPGLTELFEVGIGPIRMILVDNPAISIWNPENRIFIASGSEMYKASYESGSWSSEKLGDLETSSGPVSGVAIREDLGAAVFVDGVNNYLYTKVDSGDALIIEDFGTFADFGYPPVLGATNVIWIDGFFIFNKQDTAEFYVSEWNSISVSALSFASAEGDPDNIMSMISNHRDLWLFNERTTEVWANTGNADFPFERIQGGFIEKGCVAADSVAKIDGVVFWLGRDEFGEGIVFAAQGLTPQRISTHAIEQAIQSYADISTARAYTYQDGGHSFYVLNFAEATWVYDLSTKLWHERAYTEDGLLQRHRADCHAFFPDLRIHLVGDYESGEVYKFDESVYTDNGDPITRLRTSPHVSNSGKMLFFNEFTLDMETGVGTVSGQGSDPQVMLDFSNDGGHTWIGESWASAGQQSGGIGDYKKRVIWRRLGKARDRVFRVKITDPVKVVLMGAELEIEGGRS